MTRKEVAKVHSNHSQRTKPRGDGDKKVTFKGFLDNPHRISWPSTPMNVQNSTLACLVGLLEGVADYHQKCRIGVRKWKKLLPVVNDLLHRNPSRDLIDVDQQLPPEADINTMSFSYTPERPEPPPILKSLTYGINAITNRLELQIQNCGSKVMFRSTGDTQITQDSTPLIRYLFVCRADVDPPIIIDHLPHLVATYNVLRPADLPPIILIPLPKGAEATLAHAMGVRRLAAIAIDTGSAAASERLAMANELPLVTAPWLSSQPAKSFIHTHIKQLRTTAPRDMKVAKEARARAKAVAKSRRSSQKRARAVFVQTITSQPS